MSILVKENLRADLILLLPTALGDSVMTLQAIRVYFNFLKSFKIRCVGTAPFTHIYSLLCNEIEYMSYEDLYMNSSKIISSTYLIDFRSDVIMQRLPIKNDYIFQFEFEPFRRIKVTTGKSTVNYFEIKNIKNLFTDVGYEFVAWKMDGELISVFIDFTISRYNKYSIRNIGHLSPTVICKTNKKGFTPFEIMIFPCGSSPEKHWPIHYWHELINKLNECNIKVNIFLGPGEGHYVPIFESKAPIFRNIKWKEIIDKMNNEFLVLCNDCGPMHVFGVLGFPLIAIFGPTDDKVWFNYDTTGYVLTSYNGMWPSTSQVMIKIFEHKNRIEYPLN
jgi:hypothetical protein